MAYLTPSNPAFFCAGIQFVNGNFSFRYGSNCVLRGKGSFIDHKDRYSEIEGELLTDGFKGTLINIDLFADRSRGVFTFPTVPDAFLNIARFFSYLVFSHKKNATIVSEIGCCRQIDDSHLILNHLSGGHAHIIRNHDQKWGPHIFRGHLPQHGPVTVYV